MTTLNFFRLETQTMIRIISIFALILLYQLSAAQSPCSVEAYLERAGDNAKVLQLEMQENEAFTQQFILDQSWKLAKAQESTYTIPVVIHVFHWGDDGLIDEQQALSGLQVLNDDFKGLNDDWDSIDAEFDSIKASLDIEFCLASLDPDGNPTSGIIYHEDEAALTNDMNVKSYGWDNHRYFNFYLPKYAFGDSSDFTAYATYPALATVEAQDDGVVYSSIRWGYGSKSIVEPGHDWVSVVTHEVGHWLNLRHTFQDGCFGAGDMVDDTPPTEGGTIIPEGCYNFDGSCGVSTNGSNYMDYNHGCKKMFTQGQVDRMLAALQFPGRIGLWSEENLIGTGCLDLPTNSEQEHSFTKVDCFPNPSDSKVFFNSEDVIEELTLFNLGGQLLESHQDLANAFSLDVSDLPAGVYLCRVLSANQISAIKIVVD